MPSRAPPVRDEALDNTVRRPMSNSPVCIGSSGGAVQHRRPLPRLPEAAQGRRMRTVVEPCCGQMQEDDWDAVCDAPSRFLPRPRNRSGRCTPVSPTAGCPGMMPPSCKPAFHRAFPTYRVCGEQTLSGRGPVSPGPLDQRAVGCRIVAFLRRFGAREVVFGIAAVCRAPRGGEQSGLAVHFQAG